MDSYQGEAPTFNIELSSSLQATTLSSERSPENDQNNATDSTQTGSSPLDILKIDDIVNGLLEGKIEEHFLR